MKIAVRIVQVLVGLLFIFSGLVKANDPLGLSFKMQEFFELWTAGFTRGSLIYNALSFFHNNSLTLSIIMITLEILAGVALLIGWKKRVVLWLLLTLIIFFTFLTGYAYLSGKFTNCGCFGDCLPITPLSSFTKDIILLVMILFLIFGQKHVTSIFSKSNKAIILLASLLLSLGLQWYVLNYLPIADCLPFKKGNNIAVQMKPSAGSVPDSFAIRFIYQKGGKQFEFAPENLPADFTTYKFIDRKQTLVRKGNAEPAIKGFSLVGITSEDSAQIILSQPIVIAVFSQDFKKPDWITSFKSLADAAKAKALTIYIASPNVAEAQTAFANTGISNIQFFNTDFTVVRTVARTNPTVLIIKNGTIEKKYSKKGLYKAALDLSAQKF
jgi:uncharacterized membrane protein YphA (DoxX/SURF4 family)